jgi:hypothetical protein
MEEAPYHLIFSQRLAELFSQIPTVESVTLSGSRTSGVETDAHSDIDLCVYTTADIPIESRQKILQVSGGAVRASMGLGFWGTGDIWFEAQSNLEVDMVYSSPSWLEENLDRILRKHQASGGYTTCLWHSVRTSDILFDRSGWFTRQKAWTDQPYPEELRNAIINHNFPILRDLIPSYRYNVEKSLPRYDRVFINNEITWMLASYFDVLFAFNRVPHPGAKRLILQAERLCPQRPPELAAQVNEVLAQSALPDDHGKPLLTAIDRLVDGLETLLKREKTPE